MASTGVRRTTFPDADYRSVVATAANLARAVAAVHAAGHVVGDVNERLAMVDARCTVTLIDCDSFQVGGADGALHTCDVGVPMFQPPELQDAPTFRGLRRKRNHDAFGLAVLVFQLLFLGRHPFAGRPTCGGDPPEIPEAIRRRAFAWSPDPAGRSGLGQPPATPPLGAAGGTLAEYFCRAFGREGEVQGRTTPRDWARALDDHAAALRPCASDRTHWHLPGSRCPLCAVEGAVGARIFRAAAVRGAPHPPTPDQAALDAEADALWRAIEAVAGPPPRPSAPSPADFAGAVVGTPLPPPAPRSLLRVLAGAFGLADGAHDARAEHRRRQTARLGAAARYDLLSAAWRTPKAVAPFAEIQRQLRAAADGLRRRHAEALAAGRAGAEAEAWRMYLSRFAVADAAIPGVGTRRKATLAGYGVQTAADVTAQTLARVPGFGPQLTADLLAWRARLEASPHPPPVGSFAAAAFAAALKASEGERFRLLARLREGVHELAAARRWELEADTRDMDALRDAALALAQADADLAVTAAALIAATRR